MSSDSINSSRRSLLTGSIAAAAYLTVAGRTANAQSTVIAPPALPCHIGFDFASYSINDVAIAAAPAAGDNKITLNHFRTTSFSVVNGAIENRNLLTIDLVSSDITDFYVFNQANNELLFWKKLGSSEVGSSAMMVLNASHLSLKLTVVARHASLGYLGQNFDLAVPALNYAGAVGTYNAALLCGGSTILRPYTAPEATGGQGNLGLLHRVNIQKLNNSQVKIFLAETPMALVDMELLRPITT